MYMAAPGEEFQEYPTPNSSDHLATITNKKDSAYYTEYSVEPQVVEDDSTVTMIAEGGITITVDKATAMMTVTNAQGETVIKEAAPIQYRNGSTIQTLATSPDDTSMAVVRRTDASHTRVKSSTSPTATTG